MRDALEVVDSLASMNFFQPWKPFHTPGHEARKLLSWDLDNDPGTMWCPARMSAWFNLTNDMYKANIQYFTLNQQKGRQQPSTAFFSRDRTKKNKDSYTKSTWMDSEESCEQSHPKFLVGLPNSKKKHDAIRCNRGSWWRFRFGN